MRVRPAFACALLVLASACSPSGPAGSTTTTVAGGDPESCGDIAVRTVDRIQFFVDGLDDLTLEELAEREVIPGSTLLEADIGDLAVRAGIFGCTEEQLDALVAEEQGRLRWTTVVQAAVIRSLRNDLAPPETGPAEVAARPGDDLQRIVDEAAPGVRVALAPGTYRLEGTLVVDRPLTIVGAGREETRLESTAGGAAVVINGERPTRLEGLTVAHVGDAAASVLLVIGGGVELDDVAIGGALVDEEAPTTGSGLLAAAVIVSGLGGDWPAGGVTVTDSVVEDNAFAGVTMGVDTRLQVEGSVVTASGECGVCALGQGDVSIRDSTIAGNVVGVQFAAGAVLAGNRFEDHTGAAVVIAGEASPTIGASEFMRNDVAVQVGGSAQPRLEGNRVLDSGTAGFLFGDDAAGEARDNMVTRSGTAGIVVGDRAAPTLDDNTVFANGQGGIVYRNRAAGRAVGNRVSLETVGVQVADEAAPVLDGNTLRLNEVGVLVAGSAIPELARNDFDENDIGVQVGDDAAPELGGNRVHASRVAGMLFGESAGGTARQNEVTGSGEAGIQVIDGAAPRLVRNVLAGNGTVGLSYGDQAGGAAEANQIERHEVGIQVAGSAAPRLVANEVRDSAQAGMLFGGDAGGDADGNTVTGSGTVGVQVTDRATPRLTENTLVDNGTLGISYRERAAGEARGNVIEGHEAGIQVGEDAAPGLFDNDVGGNAVVGAVYRERAAGSIEGTTCAGTPVGIVVTDDAAPEIGSNSCRVLRP